MMLQTLLGNSCLNVQAGVCFYGRILLIALKQYAINNVTLLLIRLSKNGK